MDLNINTKKLILHALFLKYGAFDGSYSSVQELHSSFVVLYTQFQYRVPRIYFPSGHSVSAMTALVAPASFAASNGVCFLGPPMALCSETSNTASKSVTSSCWFQHATCLCVTSSEFCDISIIHRQAAAKSLWGVMRRIPGGQRRRWWMTMWGCREDVFNGTDPCFHTSMHPYIHALFNLSYFVECSPSKHVFAGRINCWVQK